MKRIYIILIVLAVIIILVYFANKRYQKLQADRLQAQINTANTEQTNGNGLIRYLVGLFGNNNTPTEQEYLAMNNTEQEQTENDYFNSGGGFN